MLSDWILSASKQRGNSKPSLTFQELDCPLDGERGRANEAGRGDHQRLHLIDQLVVSVVQLDQGHLEGKKEEIKRSMSSKRGLMRAVEKGGWRRVSEDRLGERG